MQTHIEMREKTSLFLHPTHSCNSLANEMLCFDFNVRNIKRYLTHQLQLKGPVAVNLPYFIGRDPLSSASGCPPAPPNPTYYPAHREHPSTTLVKPTFTAPSFPVRNVYLHDITTQVQMDQISSIVSPALLPNGASSSSLRLLSFRAYF